MNILKTIEQRLRKIWRRRFPKNELPRIFRANLKFKECYPQHEIGHGTYGMPSVFNYSANSKLRIGNYCSIAQNVQIFLGGNHRTDWVTTYPFPAYHQDASHIKDFERTKGDVNIGSDVWLCANSIILSGVSIGHGAVIANGSVVSNDVPPYAIVAGNPAKVVKYRFDEATRDRLLAAAWWEWPIEEVLQIMDVLCSTDIEKLLTYAKSRNPQASLE
jgi:acetyltransferase-like isoleucine patch superfamily enzyme